MKKIITLLTLTTLLFSSDLVIKQSTCNVTTTVYNLKKLLKQNHITIFATINHSANAKSVGMKLAPSVMLYFGKPKMGTKLIQKEPLIAYDLPLRVLIFEDGKHQTKIAYRDGSFLEKNYHLNKKIATKISKLLDNLTTKASQCKKD